MPLTARRSREVMLVRAEFAKVQISTAAIGAELIGYPNRGGTALSTDDPLPPSSPSEFESALVRCGC